MSSAPGWYPDPDNGALVRWWDGRTWTPHVQPAPIGSAAPQARDQGNQRPTTSAAEGHVGRGAERGSLEQETRALRQELEELRSQVVETRDAMILQEVGIYEYAHPLESSGAYRDELTALQAAMKTCIAAGGAVTSAKKWVINGSEKAGAKMVGDFAKLILRAYNTEADNLVRTLKPYSLSPAVERLAKLRASIAKLGTSMQLAVTDTFHGLRVRELELTADYQAKLAEEREREREHRARLKEEEAARREFEREQARLQKERAHYEAAAKALREKGDAEAASQAEGHIEELQRALDGVTERAANIRAGYVYVISNMGSFGDAVVKIGMTRRLEPLDRIRELGDASVPFRFDVHALIFSEDAVGLERALHERFAGRRLNLVNAHREFFYATPHDVKTALLELQGSLLTYVEDAEALEWHQSETVRRSRELCP